MEKSNEIIVINTPDKPNYKITIGSNIIDSMGLYIKNEYGGKKITVITDETVHELYFHKLQEALLREFEIVNCVVVKPGEKSKSISTFADVTNQLTLLNHRRSDLIIAFGGGVIGDLGGFVASVYLRGVPFIQIPTTLLSQVDSSVGGKVAINIDGGKNLIGSFYNPLAVYIDVETLNTLTKSEIKDGLGEIIKYGFIHNKEILEELFKFDIESFHESDIEKLITNCVKAKKFFVELDFYDVKERMILNFGHTLAHAIEKEYGYGTITHGQAVAAGMYMISKMLYDSSYLNNDIYLVVESLLIKYDMNINYKLDKDATIMSTLNDKKSFGQIIKIIIVNEIGKGEILELEIDKFENMIVNYLNN